MCREGDGGAQARTEEEEVDLNEVRDMADG
jgi:hypothetical protein